MKRHYILRIAVPIVLTVLAAACAFSMAWAKEQEKANQMILVPLSPIATYAASMQFMTPRAAVMMEKMIVSARYKGICIEVLSSFRSTEYQADLYDRKQGSLFVAKPGTSEHETGTAADIVRCGYSDDLDEDFTKTAEYEWLKSHASEFGFSQSYTEENQAETGFPPEPWHWNLKK